MEKKIERNRENTEKLLLSAVDELVKESGFENLGINGIAAKAGVSKMLIYRYFESLDGIIAAYIKQYDFWINQPAETFTPPNFKEYLKIIIRKEIAHFRNNSTLRYFRRWELSSNKPIVKELRDKREESGVRFIEFICQHTNLPNKQIAAIATLINASITYIAILEENCAMYSGINIQSDEGWEQIAQGIDLLIDVLYKNV